MPSEKHWFYIPPWASPNFTVTTIIEGSSRFDPGRPDATRDFLRRIYELDVVI